MLPGLLSNLFASWFSLLAEIHTMLFKSINQILFSFQTNNNNNIHTFINMNTERAGNEVILLI